MSDEDLVFPPLPSSRNGRGQNLSSAGGGRGHSRIYSSFAAPVAPPLPVFNPDTLPTIHQKDVEQELQQQHQAATMMMLPTSTMFFPAPPAVTEKMFMKVDQQQQEDTTKKKTDEHKEPPHPSSQALILPIEESKTLTTSASTSRSSRRPAAPPLVRRSSVYSSFGPQVPHAEHDVEVLKQITRIEGCGPLNRAQITHVTVEDLTACLRENLPSGQRWDCLTDMTSMEPTKSVGFVTASAFQHNHSKISSSSTSSSTLSSSLDGSGAKSPSHRSSLPQGQRISIPPPANARHLQSGGDGPVIEAPTRAIIDTEPLWRKNLLNSCGYILYVPHRHLMDDGAMVIRELIETNHQIIKLDARANGFTPAACAEIMAALPSSGIQSLDLSAMHGFPMNHLGELGAHALKTAFQARPDPEKGQHGCQLRALRLQNIGSFGILHLINIQTFEFGACLQVLDLRGNNIGQSTINGFIPKDAGTTQTTSGPLTTTHTIGAPGLKGIVNTQHSSLNSPQRTTHDPLRPGVEIQTFLTDLEHSESQAHLHLPIISPQNYQTMVFDSLFIRLCKSLKVSRIQKLLLGHNHLHEDEGNGEALISLLSNPTSTITYLDLSHNHYGRKFGQQLGQMFHKDQHTLTQLVLDFNPNIKDAGASSICSGLTANSTLKYLSMRGCKLTQTASIMSPWFYRLADTDVTIPAVIDPLAPPISSAASSPSSPTAPPLNLLGPSDDTSTSWIEMLRVNQVLLRLNLSENLFATDAIAKLFRFGVAHNHALHTLELHGMKLSDEPKKKGKKKHEFIVATNTANVGGSTHHRESTVLDVVNAPPTILPELNEVSLISSLIYALRFNSQLTLGNPSLQYLDFSHNDLGDSFVLALYKHVVHHNVGKTNLLSVKLAYNNISEKLVRLLADSMKANARSQRTRMLANYTRTWKEIRGCEMLLEKTNHKILESIELEAELEREIDRQKEDLKLTRARELEATAELQRELNQIIQQRERALVDLNHGIARLEQEHEQHIRELSNQQFLTRHESTRERKKIRVLQIHKEKVDEVWESLAPVRIAGMKVLAELESSIEEETKQLISFKKECDIMAFKLFMTSGRILRSYQFFLILYSEQPRCLRVSRRMRLTHLQEFAKTQGTTANDYTKLFQLISERAPAFHEKNIQKYFEIDLEDFFQWFFDAPSVNLDASKRLPLQAWSWNLLEHYMKVPSANVFSSVLTKNLSILQPSQQQLLQTYNLAAASAAHSPPTSAAIQSPTIPTTYSYQDYRHFLNLQFCYSTIYEFARKEPLQQLVGGVPLLGTIKPSKEAIQREKEREKAEKEREKAAATNSENKVEENTNDSSTNVPFITVTTPSGQPLSTTPSTTPLAVSFENESRLLSSFDIPLGSTLLFLLKEEAKSFISVKQKVSHAGGNARTSMQLNRRFSMLSPANFNLKRGSLGELTSSTNTATATSTTTESKNLVMTSGRNPAAASDSELESSRQSQSGPIVVNNDDLQSAEEADDDVVELDDSGTTAHLTRIAAAALGQPLPPSTTPAPAAPAVKSFYSAHIKKLTKTPLVPPLPLAATTGANPSTATTDGSAAANPIGSQSDRPGRGGFNFHRRASVLPTSPPGVTFSNSKRVSVISPNLSHPLTSLSDDEIATGGSGGPAAPHFHRPSVSGFGSTIPRRLSLTGSLPLSPIVASSKGGIILNPAATSGTGSINGDAEAPPPVALIRLGGGLIRTLEEDDEIRLQQRAKLEKRMRRRQRKQKMEGASDGNGSIFAALNQNNVSGGATGATAAAIAATFPHLSFNTLDWHEVDVALWWTVGDLKHHLCQLFHIPEHLVLDLQYVPGLKPQGLDPNTLMASTFNTYRGERNRLHAGGLGSSLNSSRGSLGSSSNTPTPRLFMSPGQHEPSELPPNITTQSSELDSTSFSPTLSPNPSQMQHQSLSSLSAASGSPNSSTSGLLRPRERDPVVFGSTASVLSSIESQFGLYRPPPANQPPVRRASEVMSAQTSPTASVKEHRSSLTSSLPSVALMKQQASQQAAQYEDLNPEELGLDLAIVSNADLEGLLRRALAQSVRMEKQRLKRHRKAMAAAERLRAGGFYAAVSKTGTKELDELEIAAAAKAAGAGSHSRRRSQSNMSQSSSRGGLHDSSDEDDSRSIRSTTSSLRHDSKNHTAANTRPGTRTHSSMGGSGGITSAHAQHVRQSLSRASKARKKALQEAEAEEKKRLKKKEKKMMQEEDRSGSRKSKRKKRSSSRGHTLTPGSQSVEYDFTFGTKLLEDAGLVSPSSSTLSVSPDSGKSLADILKATSDIAREVRESKARSLARAEKKASQAAARALAKEKTETIQERQLQRPRTTIEEEEEEEFAREHDGSEDDESSVDSDGSPVNRRHRRGHSISQDDAGVSQSNSRSASRNTSRPGTAGPTTSRPSSSLKHHQTTDSVSLDLMPLFPTTKHFSTSSSSTSNFVAPNPEHFDFREDILLATSTYQVKKHHDLKHALQTREKRLRADARRKRLEEERAKIGDTSAIQDEEEEEEEQSETKEAPDHKSSSTHPTASSSSRAVADSHSNADSVSLVANDTISLVDVRWPTSRIQSMNLEALNEKLQRWTHGSIGQVLSKLAASGSPSFPASKSKSSSHRHSTHVKIDDATSPISSSSRQHFSPHRPSASPTTTMNSFPTGSSIFLKSRNSQPTVTKL